MPLVDMKDMLNHAWHHGYAVGAFELINLEMLSAVMDAAERARAPVILSVGEHHFGDFDVQLLMPAIEAAAARAQVPVAIHFDHGKNIDSATDGIRLGCNSIMVDASHLNFSENTRITKNTVAMAHACGISVEGELGYVPQAEEKQSKASDELAYTSLAEAKAYVERTGVDCLAVSIGTVHGQMKGKPRLDYQRLKQINEALKMPLVIHGGSGLSDSQYHRLISNGVAKINCFTGISELAARKLRESTRGTIGISYSQVQNMSKAAITSDVEKYMRLWGAAGRAAEVLSQCHIWQPVEQLLIYKPFAEQGLPLTTVYEVQAVLSRISGVREVQVSEIMDNDSHYQYAWIIKFCHPEAVKACQTHADFQSLKRTLFRPLEDDTLNLILQRLTPRSPELTEAPLKVAF